MKADNALAMLLIVFKDGSTTQFCSFEAASIAKLLQVRATSVPLHRQQQPHVIAAPRCDSS